jgi:hypothetical protein
MSSLRHPRTKEEIKKMLVLAIEDVKSARISYKDATDQPGVSKITLWTRCLASRSDTRPTRLNNPLMRMKSTRWWSYVLLQEREVKFKEEAGVKEQWDKVRILLGSIRTLL